MLAELLKQTLQKTSAYTITETVTVKKLFIIAVILLGFGTFPLETALGCEVDIDIKPKSCPNPLNINNKGVISVAVLGSESLDVVGIDVSTVRLYGSRFTKMVSPIRSNFEDVATPVSDGGECECTTEGPDGYLDLVLKFKTQDIVDALDEVTDGELILINLRFNLMESFGGGFRHGKDCVVIISKGKPE